jgi:hypothetical protein
MFELYDEDAKRTIGIAKADAAQLGSPCIGPEHILLALLRDEYVTGLIMGILSVSQIRESILARIEHREELPTPVDLPLSSQSREVLAFAADEARDLGHRYVSNSHILLGLLQADTYVAQLLATMGLSQDKLLSQMAASASHEQGHAAKLTRTGSEATAPTGPGETDLGHLILSAIRQVKEFSMRGEQRSALNLLDNLMAEPVPERSFRIRHLGALGTVIARSIGDVHLAIRYCELRLNNDPDDTMALYAMADCLVQGGDSEKAKPYIARCYKLSAARKDGLGNGIIELLQKRFPEASLGS